jgi:membrane protease YdiL (CAAX protease family)
LETPKPKSLSALEIALVMIVTFFVFLFLSVLSLLTLGDAPTLIIAELLILAVPLIYLLFKRIDIKSYVKIDLKAKFILIGIGFGLLLLLLNLITSGLLTYIFGTSQTIEQTNQLITDLGTSPLGLLAVATSLALAGICEEFAFRGFLQNSIFKRLENRPKYSKYAFAIAVLISALVFGFFHFDPQFVYTIGAFVSGIALGYIYHRWNFVTSATAHASMNLIVLTLLLLAI